MQAIKIWVIDWVEKFAASIFFSFPYFGDKGVLSRLIPFALHKESILKQLGGWLSYAYQALSYYQYNLLIASISS